MGIPVDHRRVLDIHGLGGILKSIEGLLIVGFSWTDASNHVSIGITPQTILQYPG